ncbi:NADPH-dependent FMN reductase [Aestuariivivens sp. NBU2969]|uniref:NADPH-dependent FMN reductase n=1 Tax=Aestuariivivens sp. NBU2969 TaxID=2873267 RepID=UPI001CBB9928|nr:NADPH-dependent FMN reductase [Aestuariivivens sp. NBU2969]
MNKIIAFAGSNSRQSINKQLVTYAASLVENSKINILDLNDYELPLFSVDREKEFGHPNNAFGFLEQIKSADGIIVSLAEHNGAYTAVFKNLLDWMSRIEGKTFFGKPMLLMGASDGKRGAKSVLDIAQDRFPRHGADIVDVFSFHLFHKNFSEDKIVNSELDMELKLKVKKFQESFKLVSKTNY